MGKFTMEVAKMGQYCPSPILTVKLKKFDCKCEGGILRGTQYTKLLPPHHIFLILFPLSLPLQQTQRQALPSGGNARRRQHRWVVCDGSSSSTFKRLPSTIFRISPPRPHLSPTSSPSICNSGLGMVVYDQDGFSRFDTVVCDDDAFNLTPIIWL